MISIIENTLRFKFYVFKFIRMMQGPKRYTQTLLHGISSATLDGILPNILFNRFVRCQVSQLLTSFGKYFIIKVQYKCLKYLPLFYPLLDEVDIYDINSIRIFGVLREYKIPHTL